MDGMEVKGERVTTDTIYSRSNAADPQLHLVFLQKNETSSTGLELASSGAYGLPLVHPSTRVIGRRSGMLKQLK